MHERSGIVLVSGGRVALIRRERAGRVYYLFPGGGVQSGETPAEAAGREAWEELGLRVAVGRLLAEVWFHGDRQFFFEAREQGGVFGTGEGAEMTSPAAADGTYEAAWVDLDDVCRLDVRPRAIAEAITEDPFFLGPWPVVIREA